MSQDPAIFVADIDQDGGMIFAFPKQQRAYCKAKFASSCVDVTVSPQGHSKSRLQEKGFHAMIQPWAHSEGHRIDDLKDDLLKIIFGTQEHTNPITGEITLVLREPHTSKLNRAQYCELIDRTLDIGAECGVVLIAPDEYRRMKEQELKRAAKAQEKEAREQLRVTRLTERQTAASREG